MLSITSATNHVTEATAFVVATITPLGGSICIATGLRSGTHKQAL